MNGAMVMKLIGLLVGLSLCLSTGVSGTGNGQSGNAGSIRGIVKAQKGKPLEGVTIKATTNGGQYEIKSGSQGEFTLKDLKPGDYVLSFSISGFKTFTTRALSVESGEAVRLSRIIELSREEDPYAVIRGAILQGDGYSLPNATVTLERIDGKKKVKMETVSREGGEFAFRLKAEPASYRVTARAEGFKPSSIEITIENDEVRNIALTLSKE
jgi:hypothetical protein